MKFGPTSARAEAGLKPRRHEHGPPSTAHSTSPRTPRTYTHLTHLRTYLRCRPPSTRMVSPVTKSVSIRNTTALRNVLGGTAPPAERRGAFDREPFLVARARRRENGPGRDGVDEDRSGASSSASASVSPITPAFATWLRHVARVARPAARRDPVREVDHAAAAVGVACAGWPRECTDATPEDRRRSRRSSPRPSGRCTVLRPYTGRHVHEHVQPPERCSARRPRVRHAADPRDRARIANPRRPSAVIAAAVASASARDRLKASATSAPHGASASATPRADAGFRP